MGRRDDEELPPVEVLGAGPEIRSLQEVSTGRSPGQPGRRRAGLIVGALIVGLLGAGVLLGDDDRTPAAVEPEEEETSTTRRTTTTRRDTTTTRPSTTTTAPPGPLFAGQDVEGWVLSGNASGWTLVDIGSGAELEPGLPFDDPYSTRPVTNGVVMLSAGQAMYHDLRVPEGDREPVSLGPADQILGTVGGDAVWVVDGAYDSSPEERQARLVALDGRVLRSFPLPPGPYGASTRDGVLLSRGGRVYLATESGVDPIAVGQLIGATGSSALVFTCADDASSCGVELRSRSGDLIGRFDADPSLPDTGAGASTAEDGRFALVTHPPDGTSSSRLTLAEADGDRIADVDVQGYLADAVSWLPGDAGLLASRDSQIVWIREQDGRWAVDPLPSLTSVESIGVLAIPLR